MIKQCKQIKRGNNHSFIAEHSWSTGQAVLGIF